jgi:hypothetical protein
MDSTVTHYSFIYADDVHTQGENINAKKKSTEALCVNSRKDGLYVTTEKTKCMIISHH